MQGQNSLYDVCFLQDGGCKCRVFKGKIDLIQVLAPKSMQEKESNMRGKDRQMSRVMRKPTFWFPTWSDTNQAVQVQKMARGLKFGI